MGTVSDGIVTEMGPQINLCLERSTHNSIQSLEDVGLLD